MGVPISTAARHQLPQQQSLTLSAGLNFTNTLTKCRSLQVQQKPKLKSRHDRALEGKSCPPLPSSREAPPQKGQREQLQEEKKRVSGTWAPKLRSGIQKEQH